MIYINQVFQYVTDSKRIRVIDIEEPHVYIVNIDTSSAMPRKELYSSLTTDIKQGELLAISDPYAKMISEGDLTEVQIRKREEDWETIQKYCVPNMQDLLRKQGRENKIIEVVRDSNLGKTKIKKLLTRYWQRGMTKNASGVHTARSSWVGFWGRGTFRLVERRLETSHIARSSGRTLLGEAVMLPTQPPAR